MAKRLYDFGKHRFLFGKNNSIYSVYQKSADRRIKKDDLIVGNHYFIDGIKLILYKISADGTVFSFNNEKNDIKLYYHTLFGHFEDVSGKNIMITESIFKIIESKNSTDNHPFTIGIDRPNNAFLGINNKGEIIIT